MDRNSLKWDWMSNGALQNVLLLPHLVVGLQSVITSVAASMKKKKRKKENSGQALRLICMDWQIYPGAVPLASLQFLSPH